MFPSSSVEILLENIYNARQGISIIRQPRHKNPTQSLHSRLNSLPKLHPYSLTDEDYEKLLEEPEFRQGGNGLHAIIPDQKYLYRLSGVTKVRRYSEFWRDDYESYTSDHDLFKIIDDQVQRTKRWVPLEQYADGKYSNPRGISWWTALELPASDPTKLVQTISQCGIPSDWITEYSVVLRCKVSHLELVNLTRVPTVIDGFDLEIFHPTIDSQSPTAGVAIHLLDRSGIVQEGTSEFVLHAIPVDQLEMWPIRIPSLVRKTVGIPLSEILRGSLLDYYRRL